MCCGNWGKWKFFPWRIECFSTVELQYERHNLLYIQVYILLLFFFSLPSVVPFVLNVLVLFLIFLVLQVWVQRRLQTSPNGCRPSHATCWHRTCRHASTHWRFVCNDRLYRTLCTSSSTLFPQRASPSPTRKTQVFALWYCKNMPILCQDVKYKKKTKKHFECFSIQGDVGFSHVWMSCDFPSWRNST